MVLPRFKPSHVNVQEKLVYLADSRQILLERKRTNLSLCIEPPDTKITIRENVPFFKSVSKTHLFGLFDAVRKKCISLRLQHKQYSSEA